MKPVLDALVTGGIIEADDTRIVRKITVELADGDPGACVMISGVTKKSGRQDDLVAGETRSVGAIVHRRLSQKLNLPPLLLCMKPASKQDPTTNCAIRLVIEGKVRAREVVQVPPHPHA